MPVLSRIEWELLHNKREFVIAQQEYSISGDLIPDGLNRLEISRSDKYNVIGTFFGRINEFKNSEEIKSCLNNTTPLNFELSNLDMRKLSLEDNYIYQLNFHEDKYCIKFLISSIQN